jgi:uncharacterized protein YbjT (DUF2867 family)
MEKTTAPGSLTVLVVGATGSIGRLVVEEALAQGHKVRALVRDVAKARGLPAQAARVVGDLTRPESLRPAVEGADAIVFTHGSDASSKAAVEAIDYGGVRNILAALHGDKRPRIALMTAIGVTNRSGAYNRQTEAHDWKRRGERLVRASGLYYTIVRPGWFDLNAPDQLRPVFLQGDTRTSGTPRDGVVARRQIARVLVRSLCSTQADRKTLELVAEAGVEPLSLDEQFAKLLPDPQGGIDGVRDRDNMPLRDEPKRVLEDLARWDRR